MTARRTQRPLASLVLATLALVLLPACVAGQEIALAHQAGTGPKISTSRTVAVEATDSREFVVNKDEAPSYIGQFRGGFGNTWNVDNEDERSLAEQFRSDITAELAAQGVRTVASGERQIHVVIRDWNFDAYVNGKAWYDVAVFVKDAAGDVRGSATFKEEKTIEGSAWSGAKGAFNREVPVFYANLIDAILANAEIQAALQ